MYIIAVAMSVVIVIVGIIAVVVVLFIRLRKKNSGELNIVKESHLQLVTLPCRRQKSKKPNYSSVSMLYM